MKLQWVKILVLAGAVLIMVGAVYLPLKPDRAAVVSAVATALAAVAALGSTLASNQSARESSEAARQATRALSYSAKPVIELGLKEFNGIRYAVVENVSSHRTSDLILRWRLRNEINGERDLSPLDGMKATSEGLVFSKRGPRHEAALPGFIPDGNGVESLSVEYAGLTGPTRWEVTYQFGPGISKNRHGDNRYYRPSRLVGDEEIEAR
jgi:hypothetical protein